MTTAWSPWFLPTSGHSLLEETDISRLRGTENHDSRKQQEREGRTVGMREKQAPNLQEPGDGSVQDTRHPGAQGSRCRCTPIQRASL